MIKTISNDSLIKAVNKAGKKIYSANFMLVICKKNRLTKFDNLQQQIFYYAIKSTRKIGNAVVRNKIRRRIKHILRDFIKLEPGKLANFAAIIIPKAACYKCDFASLRNEFYTIYKQL